MNWRHETWRRLYVREQGSFAALSYSARALAAMLLKHVDDRGRFVARRGEGLADAIACRVGASRGERRQIRAATAELLEDGYLVVEGPGVRIRNFHVGNGLEPAPTEHRPSIEAAPTETRPCTEPDANVSRPCIEECVKPAESPTSPGFLPSVPAATDPDPERAHAHAIPEPDAGAWPERRAEPVRFNHGVLRARGQPPPPATRQLQLMPAERLCDRARGQPPPPATRQLQLMPAERLCDFHASGRNAGQPAIPPRLPACTECVRIRAGQLAARASPRRASEPSSGGEILGGAGGHRGRRRTDRRDEHDRDRHCHWPPRRAAAAGGRARRRAGSPAARSGPGGGSSATPRFAECR